MDSGKGVEELSSKKIIPNGAGHLKSWKYNTSDKFINVLKITIIICCHLLNSQYSGISTNIRVYIRGYNLQYKYKRVLKLKD